MKWLKDAAIFGAGVTVVGGALSWVLNLMNLSFLMPIKALLPSIMSLMGFVYGTITFGLLYLLTMLILKKFKLMG